LRDQLHGLLKAFTLVFCATDDGDTLGILPHTPHFVTQLRFALISFLDSMN
jgi:hypothetical protein